MESDEEITATNKDRRWDPDTRADGGAPPMAAVVQEEVAATIEHLFPLEANWLRNIARDHLSDPSLHADRRRPR